MSCQDKARQDEVSWAGLLFEEAAGHLPKKGENEVKKLFVGNLAFQVTEAELRELFEQAGEIESVNLITDRETGRSRGFAFVEYTTDEAAQEAIQRFNGTELGGRPLRVDEARERSSSRSEGRRNRY